MHGFFNWPEKPCDDYGARLVIGAGAAEMILDALESHRNGHVTVGTEGQVYTGALTLNL